MATDPYQTLNPDTPGTTSVPTTGGSSISSTQSSGSSQSAPVQTADSILSQMISQLSEQYGTNVFNWAQSQIAPNTALTNQAVGTFMNAANTDFNLANSTAAAYNNIGAPELATVNNNANAYASAPQQAVNAGAAEANSEQGSQAGLSAAQQNLASYGINPNSGMYAELEQSNQAAAGAAAAASGTQASQATKAAGITQQQAALAADQQLPGQAVNASTAGVGAVTGAANTQFGNTSTQANADAAANPFLSTAQNLSAEGTQSSSTQQSTGTSTSNQFGNTIYTGSPTNTGGGDYAAAGGAIPDRRAGAIPDDATTGGFVSRHLSPSGGALTDDIPARLNADEFVMPKDVTRYYGHKTFQDMIIKARKAAGDPNQSPAKPTMKPAHAAGGGAIPTGW